MPFQTYTVTSAGTLAYLSGSDWNFPNKITAEDSDGANCGLFSAGSKTNLLVGYYDVNPAPSPFDIPLSATIDGVVVRIKRYNFNALDDGTVIDNGVFLLTDATDIGTISEDRSDGDAWVQASPAWQSYGSPTDTWGLSLTPAGVMDVNFGAGVAAIYGTGTQPSNAVVDAIEITVYYTEEFEWVCGGVPVDEEDGYVKDPDDYFDNNESSMQAGEDTNGQHGLFVRIPDLNLPTSGIVIDAAWLNMYDRGGGEADLLIFATNTADAGLPTDYEDYWDFATDRTTAEIAWTIESSADTGDVVQSADITTLIQEIVAMPDYVPNDNAVLFMIIGDGETDFHEFGTVEAGMATRLSVQWHGEVEPEGTITFSGSSVISATFNISPFGGITLSGSAVVSDGYAFSPTGTIDLSGSSEYEALYPALPVYSLGAVGGAIAFSGSPHYQTSFSGAGGQALSFWLTGAAEDNGTQPTQINSLGGYRSSTEASRVGFLLNGNGIRGVHVRQASGKNGEGNGNIIASSSTTLRYTAPNSTTQGPAVSVPENWYATLYDGQDSSKWVRVYRETDAPAMTGTIQLEFVPQFNNVFGASNSTNEGGTTYRGVMVRNESFGTITDIKFAVLPLCTAVQTYGYLSASGAGEIAGEFCEFPHKGFARIHDAGGTLREIVYYASRTDSILNVASTGRAMLGSTATLGSPTDTIRAIPAISLGVELADPAVNGPVQTIADETTAPTAISFSNSTTLSSGVEIASLAASENACLWIRRELHADIDATAKVLNSIQVSFVFDGETFTETLAGMYRISNETLQRYELYVGEGTLPDMDGSPFCTSTAVPFTTTMMPNATYYLSLQRRNKFDLATATQPTLMIIDDEGETSGNPPTAPVVVSFSAVASGAFNLTAVYYYLADPQAQQADKFAIRITYDGSTPDMDDTPTLVSGVEANGVKLLNWNSPVQSIPTTAKVILTTYRTSDTTDSTPTDVYTAISSITTLNTSTLHGFWRQVAEQSS